MPFPGRAARWLLLAHWLLLLLPMWPALGGPQAQGGPLPPDAFMVCTAQGMQAVRAGPGVSGEPRTLDAQEDAAATGDAPDAASASYGCALCHARVLMPLPVWAPGLAWRALPLPQPVPPLCVLLVADAPWRPLQARAPPALAG